MDTQALGGIITGVLLGIVFIGYILYVLYTWNERALFEKLKILGIIVICLFAIDIIFILIAVSKWAFIYLFGKYL